MVSDTKYKELNRVGIFTGLYDKNNNPIYAGNYVLVDTKNDQYECIILFDKYSECYKPFIVDHIHYSHNDGYWCNRRRIPCNDLYVDYAGRMQMTIIG